MKCVNVFCISDSRLTVYACGSGEVKIFDTFDFSSDSADLRFSDQAVFFKNTKNFILLDVSVEDYHLEQLPHVRGSDRKLLVKRKQEKYFPDSEYCYSELAKRLKVGRRDDVYAISGIADSSAINPVIEAISSNDIEISGVYSLPLLTETLISPLVHDEQVLVISCEEEQSGRYSFRQTFIDNGHLYFSRQTSISSSVDLAADQFRKEIDRTWQYLNNKRVLGARDRMQLILLTPPAFSQLLRRETVASHSEYLFVNPIELASSHGCRADKCAINLSAMAAFILAKNTPKEEHYHPVRISNFHKHQKINRFLLRASFFVVFVATALTTMNFKAYNIAVRQGESLVVSERKAFETLRLQGLGAKSWEVSPQEMQSMVSAYKAVSFTGSYPDTIFSILSESFSKYKDLSISDIEWTMEPVGKIDRLHQNDDMDGYSIDAGFQRMETAESNVDDTTASALSNTRDIIVNIQGSVQGFNGNYRRSIDRIELLRADLDAQNKVKNVLVSKLPLNVDSNVKTSRTLSSELIPDFGITITLNSKVFVNEH